MQEFFHAGQNANKETINSFEKMLRGERTLYFDVHEIESLHDHFVENDNLEMADRVLAIGLSLHPDSISLKTRKASMLTDKGALDEAVEMLSTLKEIDSSNSDIYINLGWIFLKKGEIGKALEYFENAVKLTNEDDKADILLEIGINLNQNDFNLEAVPFLERSLLINPDNESALFEVAYGYDRLDMNQKSTAAYEHLLEINPFIENAWYNLGIQHNKLFRYNESIDAYDYTIALNPNYSDAYFNKGNTYVNMGKFDKALDCYLEHASFKEDLNQTYQYIGDCWEQLSNPAMAVRFFQKSLELEPTNADAMYGYATALMALGDFEESIIMINQALSINPIQSDYYFALAQAYLEMSDLKQCAHSLEIGLSLSPNELLAWLELIKLKVTLSKRFNADNFIKKARREYGEELPSLLYLDAYISFYLKRDIKSTITKLNIAIMADRNMLDELHEEAAAMLEHEDIKEIVKNSDINKN